MIKEKFWKVGTNGDIALYSDELGWPPSLKRDAQSDYSETVFRYVIEYDDGYSQGYYDAVHEDEDWEDDEEEDW